MGILGNIVYPEEFNHDSILAHLKQEDELKILLEDSGLKTAFLKRYRQRLKFLSTHLDTFFHKSEWYESLKNVNNMYSMKIKGLDKNIRILFCLWKIENRQKIILLTTFEEKKSSDYSKYIVIAQQRIEELVNMEELQ